jgi:hypothetical protein
MKAMLTALGILCFASAMAVAKTGRFHLPAVDGSASHAAAPWHLPYSNRDRLASLPAQTRADR